MTAMIVNKLRPPYFGAKLIERPQLWELILKSGNRQVVVISAPAGYGKTTLMVQLAGIMKKPLVWYQLDEYDNDPAVFLQYLVAGVEQYFPGFGKEVLQIIAHGKIEKHLRLLAVVFAQSLNKQIKGNLTVVLDDYHLITTPTIHRLMQELLQQLPDNVQILIASRMSLPFSISRLTLSGKVYHVGIEGLRYTSQEISNVFAKQHIELSETLLIQLEEKTAGWPAALHFLETSHSSIEAFLHNNEVQEIYDYLASEVFDRQPKEIQQFLEATSVLEVMTPDFCDLLLERSESYQILDSLARQQIFLTSLVGKKKTYRYHQLFREFLQERLGTRRQALLHRAALLFREAGEAESAVEYLVAADSYEEAIMIIKEVAQRTLNRGGWQTVARWLETLPIERVATDPWLSLYLGTVEVRRGRLAEAQSWASRATSLFAGNGDLSALTESRLLAAQILCRYGQFVKSLKILEEILGQISGSPCPLTLTVTLEKSLCLLMTGQVSEAEATLRSTIEIVKWNNEKYFLIHLLEGLGDLLYMQGNYHKALQTYQQAAELSLDRVLPSYYMQDSISTIYQDWGEFDKALDYAKRNVAIKENLGLDEVLPSAYIQLASIHADRGEWKQAEEQYNRAIQLIRDHNGGRFYLVLNLIFLAQCLGLQGRWIEARVKSEEALMEAKQLSGLALAVCRSVGSVVFAQTGSLREGADMLKEAIAALEKMKLKKQSVTPMRFRHGSILMIMKWLACKHSQKRRCNLLLN
ncbi:MAG: tetratricopeptide repeat protein [Veillonellaceae bacterium]|nr:tetratricopeptide repeat protein [Veillonellaceae bacterium]